MMFKENHHHKCQFAEELVSFLYDEINSAERNKFNEHLSTCSFCQDELSDFLGVRQQIFDWKLNEFEVLTTPLIEIPPTQTKEIGSWFSGLREYFSFSPMWLTVSSAMAVLAIFFGLGFVLIGSFGTKDDLAHTQDNNAVPSPTLSEKIEKKSVSNSNSDRVEPEILTIPTKESNLPKTVNTPIKAVDSQVVKTAKPKVVNSNRLLKIENKVNKVAPKSNKRFNVPSLTEETEDEEDLTLSKLFENIGDEVKK